ncbi:MlaD family protein [Nocardia inohanensis]|uniref:MlaD family protein n=1 Tax=Nocardia inohanensis TaxID=209246 RepID=UPI001FE1ABB6|nr:MlaD family protein [Nocardia inohanensis]
MSLSAILAVLVCGVVYMAFGVLHFDPRRTYITAEMHLDNSGGLGAHAPILLAGVQVGRTESVTKQAGGVLVRLRIESRYRIPLSSTVRIEQLSALGEPYVQFTPPTAAGPYLADGQVVPAERTRMPMTITELSGKLVTLLEQLKPEVIANLVGTFDRALADTDPAMQTLQRSTSLLAATLLSRTQTIRQLFSDMQALGGDIDWMGPALAAAGPEFGAFGTTLNKIVENGAVLAESRPVSSYFTGDGLVPFLRELTTFLERIGPTAAQLSPVLAPMVTDAMNRTPALDISALISQALQGVDADGTLRFRITVK